MKDVTSVESLDVPSNVSVNIKARKITVEGPRGTLTKSVSHVQMDIQVVSRGDSFELGIGKGRARKSRRAWQRRRRGLAGGSNFVGCATGLASSST